MSKIKNNIKILLSKAHIFLVDHLHLLFRSAADNHLRIQKMSKGKMRAMGTEEILEKSPNFKKSIQDYSTTLEFNSFTHLKRYQRKVRLVTFSTSSTLAAVLVAAMVLQFVALGSKAATFSWIQSSWTTSSNDIAKHVKGANLDDISDRTEWNKYSAKDSSIDVSTGKVKLATVSGSTTQTSDVDFNAGTNSGATVSGSGDSAKVLMASVAETPISTQFTSNGTLTISSLSAVSATVDISGAAGGSSGGNGARVQTTLNNIAPSTVLNVYVGGAGEASAIGGGAGSNGGANAGSSYTSLNSPGGNVVGGGGGASDIRIGGTALADRVIVAGGGGGGGVGTTGGAGGQNGSDGSKHGTDWGSEPGTGATQSGAGTGGASSDAAPCTAGSVGSLGIGGAGGIGNSNLFGGNGGGGGGGGYYGGGGGGGSTSYSAGGGGGSSYCNSTSYGCDGLIYTSGYKTGNGLVSVVYTPYVYSSPSTFTSSVIDTGHKNSSWGNLSWSQTLNGGTIGFLISTSEDNSTWTNFKGYDGTDQNDCSNNKCYTTNAGQQIHSTHNGARYIKYKAFLSTLNVLQTPELQDVTVNYSYYTPSPSSDLVKTSDADFGANTNSNVGISGSGTNALITLLKADHAVCTSDSDCSNGNCDTDFATATKYCHTTASSCADSSESPWEQATGYEKCSGNNYYKLCSNSVWGAQQTPPANAICDAGGGAQSGYKLSSSYTCTSGIDGGFNNGVCTSCSPYIAASASSCKTSCMNTDNDCFSGYHCTGYGAPCVSNWVSGPCGGIQVYYLNLASTYEWGPLDTCPAPQCSGGNLVADNSVDFSAYPARNACKNIGGRLPTSAELLCIITNAANYGGNFGINGTNYWSATENLPWYAYYRSMVSGAQNNILKTASNGMNVRCVK